MLFKKIIFSILLVSMTTKLLGGLIFCDEFTVNDIKETVSKTTNSGLMVSFELLGLKLESDPNTEISNLHFIDIQFPSKLFSLITTGTTNICYLNSFSIPTTTRNCGKQAFYQTFRV